MRHAINLTVVLSGIAIGASSAIALGAEMAKPAVAPGGSVRGKITIDGRTDIKGFKLQETVVFLRGPGLSAGAASSSTPRIVLLDQKDKTYIPHVLPVLVGTPVEIRNSDPELHNVHASAKKNQGFNMAMPSGTKPQRKVFSSPELVTLACNVHRDMRAYVLVLENPHFTLATAAGDYEIRDVPPGEYELALWHEKFEEMKKELIVKAGESVKVVFEFKSAMAIRRK